MHIVFIEKHVQHILVVLDKFGCTCFFFVYSLKLGKAKALIRPFLDNYTCLRYS